MTAAPLCPRCKRPISPPTAATMTPGSVALHAACSHAASEEVWRRITVRPLPPELTPAEPTYQVVGVRADGSREIVSVALDRRAAAARAKGSGRVGFARFLVEPE